MRCKKGQNPAMKRSFEPGTRVECTSKKLEGLIGHVIEMAIRKVETAKGRVTRRMVIWQDEHGEIHRSFPHDLYYAPDAATIASVCDDIRSGEIVIRHGGEIVTDGSYQPRYRRETDPPAVEIPFIRKW